MLRGFAQGVALLLRGFRAWGSNPGVMLLGLIPAVITSLLFGAGIVALAVHLEPITAALTGFAESWDEPWQGVLRVAVGGALLGASVLVAIYTFTLVTLTIGAPFFERISRAVDDRISPVAEGEEPPFLRGLLRGIGEGLALLALTLLTGAALFLLGLIPLVGAVTAAVAGAFTGGWVLALELTATAFERRGIRLGGRRRMLARERSVTLGFGVAAFLLFLVPLGAVATMPAAVAGATLLARRSLGEPTSPRAAA
ncbi:EI24 domain-containing protein [Salinibacterium sp. SYSU T00001]|uniref:EI24 domain-containing protein n=1 Tax=Homoserinimonas sedimenticola TaxID=2986805 RepID=UPI0022365151|nr:EI24 domain-containing protein [Salinibacterium sedimenticola]MCW4384237.1 EI24 domain-containing protein [Salinibacterium sedimenticola]